MSCLCCCIGHAACRLHALTGIFACVRAERLIVPNHPTPSPGRGERRTLEQLREQYQVEKELAERLRTASRADRLLLYSACYEELFRRVPHHSQLSKKAAQTQRADLVAAQLRLLGPFLKRSTRFLEIGAGDCALSLAVSSLVDQVCAVDVSAEIARASEVPENFRFLLSDGISIPVLPGSIDVAYSNQLMEHLHPDDALDQLVNIYKALAPGAIYICLTPNRLTGPHDISRYFDPVATGFHLKEYTATELIALFRRTGFTKVHQHVGRRGTYTRLPDACVHALEMAINATPDRWRRSLTDAAPVRALLKISLMATK